jgi:menaquinone-specific isochorismate synthase
LNTEFINFLQAAHQKTSKSGNTIITYTFSLDGINLFSNLYPIAKGFEKYFYWDKPTSDFSFIALGELLSIKESGKARFIYTDKKVREILSNFFCNDNEVNEKIPLFVGGLKFLPENEKSIWEDFSDSHWFVPKIIVSKVNNNEYVTFNFIFNSDASNKKIAEEFDKRLALIKQIKQENFVPTPKVLHLNGNSPKDKKRWQESVRKTLEKIESDIITKVVLSRMVEIEIEKEPNVFNFISSFREDYADCYIFSFHSGKSTFFGASPEKFIQLGPEFIYTDALAGSAPRGKNEIEDDELAKELLERTKDLNEHKTVLDFIEQQFKTADSAISFDSKPQIKKLKNIQHLWTPVQIKVTGENSIFQILEKLHPTPAVCGLPQNSAIQVIKETEDYPRGLYSGIVGWFNRYRFGEFTVSIRSALNIGKKIYAFAGGGILDGSDPAQEVKETDLKFKPILSLFDDDKKS